MGKSIGVKRLGHAVDRVASGVARVMGQPLTFIVVFATVLGLTIGGFALGVADTWFGAMHSIGPVVTLLLVFLLQYGQSKNTRAVQLKLDELIANDGGARNQTIKAERQSTKEMERMERRPRGRRRHGSAGVRRERAAKPAGR